MKLADASSGKDGLPIGGARPARADVIVGTQAPNALKWLQVIDNYLYSSSAGQTSIQVKKPQLFRLKNPAVT